MQRGLKRSRRAMRMMRLLDRRKLARRFDFHGVLDVSEVLEKARIDGAALEAAEILSVLGHARRATAWMELLAKRCRRCLPGK